ncbi:MULTISPECIES: glycosyltransferase [Halolamina]|uniref:Glycosyltransferase, catalytic subunit of cellulose synthase and poly-beta-1,6-N-acetylglucosamine synthase n=1 Tax=Halolamina pelagica TaxID=699431 RepID=A0A1I5QXQ8_9EURY|nr:MULTISPECIES: glycosyltransferase [Halolamina]NHX35598.1 glycosyltransferase [Halolamina sp. R1-12]SFP51058.1 Glycosyltransferase, catalytic subunit of cellulose synthase and poly-beta-1,6-N-acetylglucosamine synthase [Halolamina pelagica]
MNWLGRYVGKLLALTGLPYLAYLALYAVKRPEGSPIEKESWEPTVSIVLPTYNEEDIVVSKLEDVLDLDYPMEKVELVVVDSSEDTTPELIREFFDERSDPELTLIREEERRGLAVALNEAYEAASNEVVVKTDCDSRVAPGALREATANLSDPSVDAVTGRNAEVLGGSEVERGYRDIQARIQTLESHIDSTFIFHGPFSAFRNDAIVPIDSDSIADDTELALKIRKNGGRVVFDPEIEYKEAAHSEFTKRRQQKDRRAMGLLRLLWRQRGMLGRFGGYGRAVLPFNWWFMIVTPWLLATSVVGTVAISFGLAGPLGAITPLVLGSFVLLGSRERLGSVQPVYSILDTQFSLVRASVLLLSGKGDGTWSIDEELREAFDQ